jgi:hypothetical protein
MLPRVERDTTLGEIVNSQLTLPVCVVIAFNINYSVICNSPTHDSNYANSLTNKMGGIIFASQFSDIFC